MKRERELKDVLRDIQRLDLQRLNGTLSQREYERRRSVLDTEWKVPVSAPSSVFSVPEWVTETKPLTLEDFDKMAGKLYTGIDYANGNMTTVTMKTDKGVVVGNMTMGVIDWERAMKGFGWGSVRKSYLGESQYQYSYSPPSSNLAQSVWDECEGVVMCECENMDCLRRIDITRDEYIQASYTGNARLTHPECSYGIVNSKLIHRTPKWNVWWKGDQPGW